MAVFEDRILTDPTAEEEGLASSVVSVALDPSSGVLCQLQKVGRRQFVHCLIQYAGVGRSLKVGIVWILFVQLIFSPPWPVNQLYKNPNIV